ncbi:MAG: CerR family C-terminal domain-containing protein [Pirellulales bacterium]|nr:CerR family C-terminal domain-containing protein [Pirellulales bacterium]
MDGDVTKQRVLESAGKTFAEKGYESATVREICDGAGANIAAVNYYFGDKQSLYLAACVEAQCAREGAIPMPQWQPDTPATERLADFVRTLLRRLLEDERPAWHRQLMLREMASPTEACAHVVEDYIRPMSMVLKGIIEELLPEGTSEVDGFLVGFSIVSQCLFYHVNQPIASRLMGTEEYNRLTIDRLVAHITRFSLAALGYVEPLAKPSRAAQVASR